MKFDLVAQFLPSTHEAFLRLVTIPLITVIAPPFFIALVPAQHAVTETDLLAHRLLASDMAKFAGQAVLCSTARLL